MSRFFHLTEVQSPADVQQYLAKPELQWKPGYSAYELATSWVGAGDIPGRVRKVLDASEVYADVELIEAFVEREVDLRSPGRPSQTDILALVRGRDGYAVIAVEGKADEPSGRSSRSGRTRRGRPDASRACAASSASPFQMRGTFATSSCTARPRQSSRPSGTVPTARSCSSIRSRATRLRLATIRGSQAP